MKKIYPVLLCAFISLAAHAQSPHPWSVTFNPLTLVERDGGITPGIGYHFSNRLAVFSDIGIILFSAGEYSGGVIETTKSVGYKLKPAVRFYLQDRPVARGGFIELEGMYKRVRYNAVNGIDVLDNNGNFAYTYIGGYQIKKEVIGLNFKLGNRSFFDKAKRAGMDLFIGLGSRTKKFETSGLPANARIDDDIFTDQNTFSFFWRSGRKISLPAGVKVFYNF